MKSIWRAAIFALAMSSALAMAENHTVVASNFTYTPSDLIIAVGDTVTFRNGGGVHNVVSDNGAVTQFRCASGCDGAGGNGNPSGSNWSATVTFATPGDIGYYCELHGASGGIGMAGRISVIAAGPVVPGAPTGVIASAGNAQATVSFVAPANDGGSAITGYAVTSSPAGGIDSQAGSTSLSHVVTGLSNGTPYTFTVRASNAVGAGPASQASNSVTPSAPLTLSVVDVSVAEGDIGSHRGVLTLALSAPAPVGGVAVDVSISARRTLGDAARAGHDFADRPSTRLTISAGQSSAAYAVKIYGDAQVEADEFVRVVLGNISGAALARSEARIVIVNDDIESPAEDPACLPLEAPEEQVRKTPIAVLAASGSRDPTAIAIATLQGSGPVSPWTGRNVVIRGIVTALRRDGVFVQTPDGDRDRNPATSEGIFVFTGAIPGLAVGDWLQARGTVEEAPIGAQPPQLPQTQVVAEHVAILARGRRLPQPVALLAIGNHSAPAWQERFEGMRVSAPRLTVVGPSGGRVCETRATVQSDGVFYAVLGTGARPYKDADVLAVDAGERLRVDSAGQSHGRPWQVDAGDRVDGVIGVLGHGYGLYRLFPDPNRPPTILAGAASRPVSAARGSEVTVGQFNLRRFFDDRDEPGRDEPVLGSEAYNLRLAKTANGLCAYLRNPDLVAISEVEGRPAARDLVDAVNDQTGNLLFPGACRDRPRYRALSLPGNDREGLDLAFLVSTSEVRPGLPRVETLALQQLGQHARLRHPDGGDEALFEQPPLLLRARVHGPNGRNDPLTLISVSLAPPIAADGPGEHGWSSIGEYVRAKRRAQAQHLADVIRARQASDSRERLVVLGGFEASEFGDSNDDPVGVIKLALNASSTPSLANAAADRYSVARDGVAQALDHVLVNRALLTGSHRLRVEYSRIDADFGEHHAGDFAVPLRVSDHDPLVFYLETSGRAPTD